MVSGPDIPHVCTRTSESASMLTAAALSTMVPVPILLLSLETMSAMKL